MLLAHLSSFHVSLPEISSGSERFWFCDGEHTEESLSTAEIIVSNGSVVLLPGCVKDVDLDLLSIQNHLFSVAVSFSGLIVFHKLDRDKVQQNYTGLMLINVTCDFEIVKAYLIVHKLQG